MIGEADLRANARYPLACSESRASIIIMCVRSLYGLRLQPCCDLTRRKDSAARPGQPSQRRDRRLMRHKCGDNQRVSQLTHAAAWNPVNARLTSWRFVINDDCLSLLFLSIYPCLPLSLSLSLPRHRCLLSIFRRCKSGISVLCEPQQLPHSVSNAQSSKWFRSLSLAATIIK